ncbi:unnamed protein product [Owenia fusiformis]|uniref:Uncharacterized protein n=1 Tax=Owenia fusiformis TaxID=6347 RepID=A0A8J1XJC2_OWEFU|nr:unnamed protein product [Owenia fusiformis]
MAVSKLQARAVRNISIMESSKRNADQGKEHQTLLHGAVLKNRALEKEVNKYDEFLKAHICDITELSNYPPEIEPSLKRFREVLHNNVPFSSHRFGLPLYNAYCSIVAPVVPTEDERRKMLILGCCIEIQTSSFAVDDDIMDHEETRKGRPCWYKRPEVGLMAINDASFMQSIVFETLRKEFRKEPYYMDLVERVLLTERKYLIGQNVDMTPSKKDITALSRGTMVTIYTYNTVPWLFFPIAFALTLAGVKDEIWWQRAEDIATKLGIFWHFSDDYQNCFNSENQYDDGTRGSDIMENKCTWPIIEALERATPGQLEILRENYGQQDVVKMNKVLDVYNEMNIPEVYKEAKRACYNEVMEAIHKCEGNPPKGLFTYLLDLVFLEYSAGD